MAYFAGTLDGAGKAHDDKAKAIAEQARKFTEERMRWEDMQSYTLLLMLEVCIESARIHVKMLIYVINSGTGCSTTIERRPVITDSWDCEAIV